MKNRCDNEIRANIIESHFIILFHLSYNEGRKDMNFMRMINKYAFMELKR